jgi:hypothetical protein
VSSKATFPPAASAAETPHTSASAPIRQRRTQRC